MIRRVRNQKGEVVSFGVRIHRGGDDHKWVGSFKVDKYGGQRAAERAAKKAEAEALEQKGPVSKRDLTCGEYARRFLREYEATHKASSFDTAKQRMRAFLRDFDATPLAAIDRLDAKDWAQRAAVSHVPIVVTMFNAAIDDRLITYNPFQGLARRGKGRSEQPPPTEQEFAKLVASCSALKDHAHVMRSLLVFAAYTGMRPGELFQLRWADIDFDEKRIHVRERVYRGTVDVPKNGKPKMIALTPPARDAVVALPRVAEWVFTNKNGDRLGQSTLGLYWGKVLARAALDFDFYLATKHYAVHYMWAKLNLPERVIAEQMGWTVRGVQDLLRVYGHGDVGALEEVDRAFDGATVTPLHVVKEAANG